MIIDNKRAVTRVSAGIKSPVVFSGSINRKRLTVTIVNAPQSLISLLYFRSMCERRERKLIDTTKKALSQSVSFSLGRYVISYPRRSAMSERDLGNTRSKQRQSPSSAKKQLKDEKAAK